jgi:fructokinase
MTYLVCGEALYDVFVGEATAAGFALDARLGGSAYNVARGLARMGRPTGLLTGIATDPLGARLKAELAADGVSTAWLRDKPLRTTLALVALGADGGARYSFYGEGAADRAVTADDLPALDGISALLFGCLSLLTEPTGSSYLALAQRARASGEGRPLVTLDPNIRPTVEPDMAVWRTRLDAFGACADLVKASDEDCASLGLSPAEAAAQWRALGAGLVAVTMGSEGARLWGAFGDVQVDAPRIAVADTVGAGDTFLAALLTALDERGAARPEALAALDARTAQACGTFAVRAAAITCTRRGADLPRRAEVNA